MGYQEVAKREWALLNRGEPADPADVELALRKPHLAKSRSDVAAAEAELEQAKLSLTRTDIKAPFNALVQEKHVDIGSQVSTQDALAELVGTDEYWIRVSLPVDRLKWIRIPSDRSQKGAEAIVHFRGYQRTGRVVRMLGNLETQGRMARILVSVKDPLCLEQPSEGDTPLLIGEYVRVTIQGKKLSGVYRIPRTALRDDNTVWLVSREETLDIRTVETVWRDEKYVLIENHLSPGDRLVTSGLATPAKGLRVQIIGREEKGSFSDGVKDVRHES
jgi:RND family efflux transporter MFP subunit